MCEIGRRDRQKLAVTDREQDFLEGWLRHRRTLSAPARSATSVSPLASSVTSMQTRSQSPAWIAYSLLILFFSIVRWEFRELGSTPEARNLLGVRCNVTIYLFLEGSEK